MTLQILYSFVTGILIVLVVVYLGFIVMLYQYYRKHGQTKKQAMLSAWHMTNE